MTMIPPWGKGFMGEYSKGFMFELDFDFRTLIREDAKIKPFFRTRFRKVVQLMIKLQKRRIQKGRQKQGGYLEGPYNPKYAKYRKKGDRIDLGSLQTMEPRLLTYPDGFGYAPATYADEIKIIFIQRVGGKQGKKRAFWGLGRRVMPTRAKYIKECTKALAESIFESQMRPL